MIVGYLFGVVVIACVFWYGLGVIGEDSQDRESTAWRSTGKAAVVAASLCTSLVMAIGWMIVYLYATEVFPTMCRSCAAGFVIGVGRFGSMSSTFAFEHLALIFGTQRAFWVLAFLLAISNAALVLWVLPETRGCDLKESLDTSSDEQ